MRDFTAFSSINATEQYFSAERSTARDTAASFSSLPVTIKCKLICVNRRGASSRRSEVSLHFAIFHIVAAFLQNRYNIDSAASACCHQHHFHRAWGLCRLSYHPSGSGARTQTRQGTLNLLPISHELAFLIHSGVTVFFTDYAHIRKLATEGDLRHAEARHQETRDKSYAKTITMLQ